MGVIYHCHEWIGFPVAECDRPSLRVCLKIEPHNVSVWSCDGISFPIACNQVSSMLCVHMFGGCLSRIVATPEFYRIYDKQIGNGCDLIYGKGPKCKEDEFVDEFEPIWLFQSSTLWVSPKLPMQDWRGKDAATVRSNPILNDVFFIVLGYKIVGDLSYSRWTYVNSKRISISRCAF